MGQVHDLNDEELAEVETLVSQGVDFTEARSQVTGARGDDATLGLSEKGLMAHTAGKLLALASDPSIEIVDGEVVSSGKAYADSGLNENASAASTAAANQLNREDPEAQVTTEDVEAVKERIGEGVVEGVVEVDDDDEEDDEDDDSTFVTSPADPDDEDVLS